MRRLVPIILATLTMFWIPTVASADQTSVVVSGNTNAVSAGLSYNLLPRSTSIAGVPVTFGPIAEVGYFPGNRLYRYEVGGTASIEFGPGAFGVSEVYVIHPGAYIPAWETQGTLSFRL